MSERLAARPRRGLRPARARWSLLALDYDGRRECVPGEAGDAPALAAFNLHQRRDKGFGPALGPRAAEVAAAAFAARGFRVQRAPSDWWLGPEEAALQDALLRGWAAGGRRRAAGGPRSA